MGPTHRNQLIQPVQLRLDESTLTSRKQPSPWPQVHLKSGRSPVRSRPWPPRDLRKAAGCHPMVPLLGPRGTVITGGGAVCAGGFCRTGGAPVSPGWPSRVWAWHFSPPLPSSVTTPPLSQQHVATVPPGPRMHSSYFSMSHSTGTALATAPDQARPVMSAAPARIAVRFVDVMSGPLDCRGDLGAGRCAHNEFVFAKRTPISRIVAPSAWRPP